MEDKNHLFFFIYLFYQYPSDKSTSQIFIQHFNYEI